VPPLRRATDGGGGEDEAETESAEGAPAPWPAPAPAPAQVAASPLLPPSLLPRRESPPSAAQTPRSRAAGFAAAGSGASAQPSPSPPSLPLQRSASAVGVLLEAAAEGLLGLQRPPALAEALSPLRRTASFSATATPTPKPPAA
jgi:hypothetical protein